MKITIDKDKCIGCGLCESIADKVFVLKDGISTVVPGADLKDKENIKSAKEAADMCCQMAIEITEEDN